MKALIITFLLISAYVTTISRSMLNQRYKKRIILAVVSFIFGILFEIILIEKENFLYLLFGLLPLLYIFYYEILRVIFKPIIGKFPYSPFREKLGARVLGSGYPKNRKVKFVDYIFGISLIFLPLITLILLSTLLNHYFIKSHY
ncbi:hypothetical protein MW871_15930 [Flavobacterium sp. I-SCBP12n]|uniref:Uncharacterized protein n=2 Tax=Flavobacterium TaxID=237 RepID=A0A9X2BM83_9FLAO|nr:hypothetical protein [Flavobacterium pygoscelis]MCK8143319.1 hypothetical protein [Flavobacterium pygoscelis]MCK8143381.1 hypothetical protein [Flavobacterium pygoscelis]